MRAVSPLRATGLIGARPPRVLAIDPVGGWWTLRADGAWHSVSDPCAVTDVWDDAGLLYTIRHASWDLLAALPCAQRPRVVEQVTAGGR